MDITFFFFPCLFSSKTSKEAQNQKKKKKKGKLAIEDNEIK